MMEWVLNPSQLDQCFNETAELVRYAAQQVEPVIRKLGGTIRSPLPGLRIKLLLTATVSKKASTASKSCDSFHPDRFLANRWLFMTPYCVCQLMYFHVNMVMRKNTPYPEDAMVMTNYTGLMMESD